MIKVHGLSKELDNQPVLEDINLEIVDGEIIVILGESGAGKSVLLRHLIGLMKPDEGSVEIDGVDITKLPEKALLDIRKNIGYLFQDGALYDFMTVFENIAFPLQEHTHLHKDEIKRKVKELLKTVGLQEAEGKLPSELSGGMRKRAALARAIVLGSKILFCDEPTSGLDPIRSREITNLIRDISKELHCTTVVTSHDIYNSMRISDRLVLLKDARVLAVGSPDELGALQDPFIKEFLNNNGGR